MNISGIKQIVYQPKKIGIQSLFVLICLVQHWIVHTETNTAVTKYYTIPFAHSCDKHSAALLHISTNHTFFAKTQLVLISNEKFLKNQSLFVHSLNEYFWY